MTILEKQIFSVDLNYSVHVEDFYEYTKKAKSENSVRAYKFAWAKYTTWCALNEYDPFKPPQDSREFLVGMFISAMAKNRNLKTASITAYLAGIKHFYLEHGIIVDTRHTIIRRALAGIRRDLGTKQCRKAPLSTENIKTLLDSIDESTNLGARDRALILFGFAGAFRRSELVGIDIEHLEIGIDGISVLLPHSKTDQTSEGRVIDIPFSSTEKYCPVRILKKWISLSCIVEGPVFRSLSRDGSIRKKRLPDYSVAVILKARCKPFGFSENISGHSLRSGHVTSSIRNGTPETWIMRQTGHKSIDTLKKYERMKKEFRANSAARLDL